MPDASFPIDKIVGEELRQLASGIQEGTESILIELDIPNLDAEVESIDRNGRKVPVVTRVRRGNAEDSTRTEEVVKQAIALVTELVGPKPVWIPSAKALVTTVNGEQLRRVAGSDLVRRIHPNRVVSS